MAELGVPPKDFESFAKSFISSVQAVLAGRFEIGGSKFNVNPDSTIFKSLDEERQIGFLTLVSESARKLLRRVEEIANELNAKNIKSLSNNGRVQIVERIFRQTRQNFS